MIRVLDRLRMRCSVGVVVKRARVVAMVSQETLYELAIVELFKGILVITEMPWSVVLGQIITETIAHQTTCYPFQTLLNTNRQTWPKRKRPSHRSMRLFTLSCSLLRSNMARYDVCAGGG